MALFVKKDDERSHLQNQVAASLQERMRTREAKPAEKPQPAILDDQKQTTSLAWVWVVIVFLIIGLLVWWFVASMNNQEPALPY